MGQFGTNEAVHDLEGRELEYIEQYLVSLVDTQSGLNGSWVAVAWNGETYCGKTAAAALRAAYDAMGWE